MIMDEMMSEMREMVEQRMKRIIKKLVEKVGVSEENLMLMLVESEGNDVDNNTVCVGIPEKCARAKNPELDENGEPKKKTRAPPKKKEQELDENGEQVKKKRAPAKKRTQGVESLVSIAQVVEDIDKVPEKKVRAPAKKRAKGVESLVSIAEDIVVAKVELEYVSEAQSI